MPLPAYDRSNYWEPPKSLDDYVEFLQAGELSASSDAPRAPAGTVRRATCKHCNQPITQMPGARCVHDDPDRCRGCRAAFYRSDEALYGNGTHHWDDSLDRNWNATPKR